MGYTFKSLCIRNFKYITNNKPLKFDFMNSNIVILDGQNGYGKTTLFLMKRSLKDCTILRIK